MLRFLSLLSVLAFTSATAQTATIGTWNLAGNVQDIDPEIVREQARGSLGSSPIS